jgi:NTE family protein
MAVASHAGDGKAVQVSMPEIVRQDAGARRLAMTVSGGGARAAYEVGVLSYIFGDLARTQGRPPRIDFLSGTSAGAINAAFLAAHLGAPEHAMHQLVDLWTRIELDNVLRFGVREALFLPRMLSGSRVDSIFDVRPLIKLVLREIPWRGITHALQHKWLDALFISATELHSGRTVVFVQTAPYVELPGNLPPRMMFRRHPIGPSHVLASAAMPVFFPAVPVGQIMYVDGGLRQNTPIAPAIRFGATHVFAVSQSREVTAREKLQAPPGQPGAVYVLGKVLNAFLLDHLETDLEALDRTNALIADGTASFGPQFAERISAVAVARGDHPYRSVARLIIRPHEDVGRMAAHYVRGGRFRAGSAMARRLFRLLDVDFEGEADLASYLLFDGGFTAQLIDMGRTDARARRDELVAFFWPS